MEKYIEHKVKRSVLFFFALIAVLTSFINVPLIIDGSPLCLVIPNVLGMVVGYGGLIFYPIAVKYVNARNRMGLLVKSNFLILLYNIVFSGYDNTVLLENYGYSFRLMKKIWGAFKSCIRNIWKI